LIGLDTNLLVRFFITDDAVQQTKVDAIMRSLSVEKPGWIGLAVLMELAWVIRSTYRVDKNGIIQIFNSLLTRNELILEQADVVRQAIHLYQNSNVSFGDCLISSSALAAGCTQTLTFDRDAAKSAGMTLVS
jgi:predicted nucleic-acid-binding protein